MKKTIVLFAALTVFAVFAASNAHAVEVSDMMQVLKQVKQSVNSTLSEIGADLKAAATVLSDMDLKSADARKILNDLRKFRPYVVNCAILDPNGLKITVEPEEYRKYEDADRSGLPYVIGLLKEKKPVMSSVYATAEGINAVSIGYPIFSDKGELLGAVKMLIRQEVFLKPLAENRPCKVWVMQPNGLIIYDPDPEEVGKNIFTDPMYKPFPDLVSFARTVALTGKGAGSYEFYAKGLEDKTLVEKVAVWDTVGLYGTDWRVIAMEIEETVQATPPAK